MTKLVQRVMGGVVLGLTLSSLTAIAQEQADELAETMRSVNMPDDVMARYSPDSRIPTRGTVDSVRLVRAEGWEWDHEVRVYLPAQLPPHGQGLSDALDHRQQPGTDPGGADRRRARAFRPS